MKPVIAISNFAHDSHSEFMQSKYIESIHRAGGEVHLISLEDPAQAVAETLACDGLLLPGGADVNPALYGQERSKKCQEPSAVRDAAEWEMLSAFFKTKKPILCICRGEQLLNAFCGGTLYQDIKEIQTCNHDDRDTAATGIHHVAIIPETKLSTLLGKESLFVNSLHHQAVDKVAPNLRVCAKSEDGFVEAVEMPAHPFCLGLQWHPEHLSEHDALQQSIFDQFVAEC